MNGREGPQSRRKSLSLDQGGFVLSSADTRAKLQMQWKGACRYGSRLSVWV